MTAITGRERKRGLLLLVALLTLASVAAQGDSRVHAQTDCVAISSVTLDGTNSSVTITNNGDSTVNLGGWFVCNIPSYWEIPAVDIAPGASLVFHAGSGTDTTTDLFAGGSFGSPNGDGADGIALYMNGAFSSHNAIVSYVGWNGGDGRKSVAQTAGIWGEDDVNAENGALLSNSFDGVGAQAWFVALPGQGPVEEPEPEPKPDPRYGADLSGGAEVPSVDSDADGLFFIDVDSEAQTATWTLWRANVQQITQAHIHLGAAGVNGPVVSFLIDPDDPGVSTPTSTHFEGTLDGSDLLGDLAED